MRNIGAQIMKAKEDGRPGDAEEILKTLIEEGELFHAETVAQEIRGKGLTLNELKRIVEVCRSRKRKGDEDIAEVALNKIEQLKQKQTCCCT